MHCTGYVKNSPPEGIVFRNETGSGINGQSSPNCLVTIGRIQVASMPLNGNDDAINNGTIRQFTMRISEDGKVTFVDQRILELLSISSDEILGKLWWQIVGDETALQNAFQQLLVDQQQQASMKVLLFLLIYKINVYEN